MRHRCTLFPCFQIANFHFFFFFVGGRAALEPEIISVVELQLNGQAPNNLRGTLVTNKLEFQKRNSGENMMGGKKMAFFIFLSFSSHSMTKITPQQWQV